MQAIDVNKWFIFLNVKGEGVVKCKGEIQRVLIYPKGPRSPLLSDISLLVRVN